MAVRQSKTAVITLGTSTSDGVEREGPYPALLLMSRLNEKVQAAPRQSQEGKMVSDLVGS